MTTMAELKGIRILGAGKKDAGDVLDLGASGRLLWLLEGEAGRISETSHTQILHADEQIHEVTGSGTLRFVAYSRYVELEPGDKLGFDLKATAYRAVMESRNENIGLVLAKGLPLNSGQIWIDIGTGTGAMVHALQKQATNQQTIWIIGVDRASKMIDEAWRVIKVITLRRDMSAVTYSM